MGLDEFNRLSKNKVREELLRCCGSNSWVDKLLEHFPFSSREGLKMLSDIAWYSCTKEDWLEAFSHHPKIGQQPGSDQKFSATKSWAGEEQSGVKDAAAGLKNELAEKNTLYEKKFGYIYIVCATGKSADEMLALLNERLDNDAEKEIRIAVSEQNKITHLRINKLLS